MPLRLLQLSWHSHQALVARFSHISGSACNTWIRSSAHWTDSKRLISTTTARQNNPTIQIVNPAITPTPQLSPSLRWRSSSMLDLYVEKLARPISLRQLIFFGGRNLDEKRILDSANYVRTELPTRIARESSNDWGQQEN